MNNKLKVRVIAKEGPIVGSTVAYVVKEDDPTKGDIDVLIKTTGNYEGEIECSIPFDLNKIIEWVVSLFCSKKREKNES